MWPGRAADHSPPFSAAVIEEYSYTSTHPLGHTGPVTGSLYFFFIYIYRVSQEECARLRESVPFVKVYRYNPKHLYPKLNGYGDNGQRSLKL